MYRKYLVVAVILISCLVIWLPATVTAAPSMPYFSLEDVISGDRVESTRFEGKTVLITFFSTTCPPCVEEVPSLNALQKKYEMDGFSVVAISLDFGRSKAVKKFVEKHDITYPVVFGSQKIVYDFGGIQVIPQSFLINRKGHIVQRYMGYRPFAELERDIRLVL